MPRPLHPVGGRSLAALAIAALSLTACAAGRGTVSTRLTLGDYNHAVAEITHQLVASDFIRQRTADSPPITIEINKVTNLTTDIIAPGEQWMLMARVRGALAQSPAIRQKNITFNITPERHDTLREAGFEGDLGPTTPGTHLMTATFRSFDPRTAVNAEQGFVDLRKDPYSLTYQITDLQTRRVVWHGAVEFARQASGLVID